MGYKKYQIPKNKFQTNSKYQIRETAAKQYDLEERTLKFAKTIISFVNKIFKTIANNEISKQLIRSAGSIGANYIEANEALGKKDFLMHIRISRKEARESRYWLSLIEINKNELEKERTLIIQETTELIKILSSILVKCS